MATDTAAAVREKPILFSGPMVRAILEGRKTVTRRVVKVPNHYGKGAVVAGVNPYDRPLIAYGGGARHVASRIAVLTESPYGAVGHRLWVRETWATRPAWDHLKPSEVPEGHAIYYRADDDAAIDFWRPSIFMPRWASRLTLEVMDVRVERLQEISEEDAKAEGVEAAQVNGFTSWGKSYVSAFSSLWDSLNGKRPGCSWSDNPHVWALTFRPVPSP